MKKIESFEQACEILKIEPILPIVDMLREANQKAVIANYKLDIIQQTSVGEWQLDWSNADQVKYYPWFIFPTSRFGFKCGGVFGIDSACSCVSSRRVFPEADMAKHVGEHFIDLYNDAMSM